MSTLRELRDRVAAGEWPADFLAVDSGTALRTVTTASLYAAFSGSLDAAKALHEALLPRWEVADLSVNGRLAGHPWGIRLEKWVANNPSMNDAASVGWGRLPHDVSPARAWLLAIIDALIKEADNADQ